MRLLLILLPILTFAQSKIEINGKTNISKFTCKNTKPIVSQLHKTQLDENIPSVIKLYVKDFECNNNRMTQDFRDMMDIDNHPSITISINKYNVINPETYQSNYQVQMNGIKKNYNISLRKASKGWDLRKLINLKDFNLEPPQVLGGLVYVKDYVMINIFIENNKS